MSCDTPRRPRRGLGEDKFFFWLSKSFTVLRTVGAAEVRARVGGGRVIN